MRKFSIQLKKQVVQSRAYILMPLLTIGLVMFWQFVVAPVARLPYDTVSAADGNLLANASFDEWQSRQPSGWQIAAGRGSKLQHTVSQVTGRIDGSGLYVEVGDYTNGSVTITSPTVNVQAGTNYFFKSFYQTDTDTALFALFTDGNGKQSYRYLKNLPDYDYTWSSMSTDIMVPAGIKSMQVVIMLNGQGYAEFDAAYLVERPSELQQPTSFAKNQLTNWTLQRSGVANLDAKLYPDNRSVVISDYQTGNIGWESGSLGVRPHDYRRVDVVYQSNVPSEVWAEFELANGEYVSWLVDLLPPSPTPATASVYIESPTQAKAMQFSVQLSENGSLRTFETTVHTIAKPATFDSPVISVTFDDGWASSKENGAAVLSEYGFKGTYYINPGFLGKSQFMTDEDIQELIASGHQVGSHTNQHIDISSFSSEEIKKDITGADRYLKRRGVESIDFASPYGKYDNNILDYIMSRYNSHRGTEFGVNTKQNFNKSNLKALFVRKETTDTDLQRALDMAKRSNGWLILIYHKVEPSDSAFDVDKETFKRHMQMVKKSGIEVNTVGGTLSSL